jgi:ribosomal protein S27AE
LVGSLVGKGVGPVGEDASAALLLLLLVAVLLLVAALALAVRFTHNSRPPERYKQQNRERLSPTVAGLPPESLAAPFDGRWSCGGCGSRCAGGWWCWRWRCDSHTNRDLLLSATNNKIASGFRLPSRPCLPSHLAAHSDGRWSCGGCGSRCAPWWGSWWAPW